MITVLPRRFALVRHVDYTGVSGVGVVAYGVAFADGHAVLRWCSTHPATSVWRSLDDMLAIHGHGEATSIQWIDAPLRELEALPATSRVGRRARRRAAERADGAGGSAPIAPQDPGEPPETGPPPETRPPPETGPPPETRPPPETGHPAETGHLAETGSETAPRAESGAAPPGRDGTWPNGFAVPVEPGFGAGFDTRSDAPSDTGLDAGVDAVTAVPRQRAPGRHRRTSHVERSR